MSRTDSSSTPSTLPVEILHQIFDKLDGMTVLLSVRNVCRRLRATVDTFNRYELDWTSLYKPDFHRLLHVIRPEWIIDLTLNDRGTTIGQIGVFRSLIDIGLFTQLHSLTLLEIERHDLCVFLDHARQCSLTSLTLGSRGSTDREQSRLSQHLASRLAQPTFVRLHALSRDLCELIEHVQWPIEWKLQYLRMAFFTEKQVYEILLRASNLETLVLGTRIASEFDDWKGDTKILHTPHPRLTSVSISDLPESIDSIWSLLSSKPCLRHLKLINTGVNSLDGSEWEEFIKTKLLALNKFEFYTRVFLNRSDRETQQSTLNRLISSFRSPFWTEEKRCSVKCNWFITEKIDEIFTIPICTSDYLHYNDPNTKTFSNFATEDQQSMISTSVDRLHISLCRPKLVEHRAR